LKKSSRSLLIFSVLVGGVLFFFLAQKPHSVCDSQIEVFMESERGSLYSQEIKGQRRGPMFGRQMEACKAGNSPGACYELFALLRRVLRDLDAAPQQCLSEMGSVEHLKPALFEGLELMVLLAWGRQPPEAGMQKFGWLETSDLALFCSLKRKINQIFGETAYEKLRIELQNKLPGESVVMREGLCVNCENRRTANETLSSDEIWVRSLFSVRCDLY
jgi:hypothetical protein